MPLDFELVFFVVGFLLDDLDFVVDDFALVVLAFDFDVAFGFSFEADLVVDFFSVDFFSADFVEVFFAVGFAEVFFAVDVEVFFSVDLVFSAVFFFGAGLLVFSASFVSAFLPVDRTPIESINTRV